MWIFISFGIYSLKLFRINVFFDLWDTYLITFSCHIQAFSHSFFFFFLLLGIFLSCLSGVTHYLTFLCCIFSHIHSHLAANMVVFLVVFLKSSLHIFLHLTKNKNHQHLSHLHSFLSHYFPDQFRISW